MSSGGKNRPRCTATNLVGTGGHAIERPWGSPGRVRLATTPAERLLGQRARHVVVEDDVGVFVARPAAVSPGLRPYGLLVPRVGEPVLGPFSWSRDHRRDHDRRVDRTTIGDQRTPCRAAPNPDSGRPRQRGSRRVHRWRRSRYRRSRRVPRPVIARRARSGAERLVALVPRNSLSTRSASTTHTVADAVDLNRRRLPSEIPPRDRASLLDGANAEPA